MKLTSANKLPVLGACAFCAGMFSHTVLGSAWTRGEGDMVVLTPLNYTYADEAFDEDGNRVERGRFEMTEFSPLFEYGVSDSLTFGLQPKFRHVTLETESGTESNAGLAAADFLVRQRLWSRDRASLSVQGLVKVPVDPREDDEVAIGRDQVDASLGLAYGNRHTLEIGHVFYSADVGYRKRWDVNVDQASANFFVGWAPLRSPWSFVLRSANTMSVSKDGEETEVLTTLPDYTRHDVQFMTSYRFRNNLSLSGGVSTTYAGENTGIGNSAFMTLSAPF